MAVIDAFLVFGNQLQGPNATLNAAIPAPGLPQLQFLDVIFGVDDDTEWEAANQAHLLGVAVADQDRRGMAGVHDPCDAGGMIDPHDLPGHEVAFLRKPAQRLIGQPCLLRQVDAATAEVGMATPLAVSVALRAR